VIPHGQLKDLLSSVRVVSVPSRYDCPVASPTVLEAFASGTPVVASTSISRDLLLDGINGYAVPDALIEQGSRRIQSLLHDDNEWERMSAAARLTAESFSAEAVARRYLRHFDLPISVPESSNIT
jgi:glycosyltransferase involved in cell wall biosynthesis